MPQKQEQGLEQVHNSKVIGIPTPRVDGPLINSNLADYIVAVNADCPSIDVTFLDYPDFKLNPLGARGVGEIGLAGVAAAITNAVNHATGVRVRRLPVRIEDLLSVPHRNHAFA
jgi:xanthine dehydrogenase YagR molybdenum-binding subunit